MSLSQSFNWWSRSTCRSTRSYSEVLKRKLKRQKRETGAEQARKNLYVNLDTLPGTSVNCERLFSQAKFILTDTRKRTSPNLFEALLLLKVNATYWNQFSVAEAMGTMDRSSVHNSNARSRLLKTPVYINYISFSTSTEISFDRNSQATSDAIVRSAISTIFVIRTHLTLLYIVLD